MTLICRLAIRRQPIVVGDVLLSTKRRTGRKTNLPIIGEANQLLAKAGLSFEVGLVQKVNILADRFVVAWSGSMEQAERALRILSNAYGREKLNSTSIRTELQSIDPEKINELRLVGLIVTDVNGDQVSCCEFSWNVAATEVPGIGVVHAAGSGRDEFLRLLGSGDWTHRGTANANLAAHSILGELIDKEYRRGGTIENEWGGGFEAVTFDVGANRFEKVGDVLHTFWTVDPHEPDKAQLKPWFYKTTYWKGALVVRYARFDSEDGRSFKLTMNSLELIRPLLADPNVYKVDDLGVVDFSHKVLCCHATVERPGGKDVMHIIEPEPKDAVQVIFHADGSGGIKVEPELIRRVIEGAQAGAARPMSTDKT